MCIRDRLETIEDEMLKAQFGEDKGNVYKPESNFTAFNQTPPNGEPT